MLIDDNSSINNSACAGLLPRGLGQSLQCRPYLWDMPT